MEVISGNTLEIIRNYYKKNRESFTFKVLENTRQLSRQTRITSRLFHFCKKIVKKGSEDSILFIFSLLYLVIINVIICISCVYGAVQNVSRLIA